MRASNIAIANRLRQRGAGQWPFIITLLLLLVFAYLWWDACEERDKAIDDRAKATDEATEVKAAYGDIATQYSDLSKSVGWLTDSLPVPYDPQKRGSVPVTNRQALVANVSRDGTFVAKEGEDPVKGTLGVLLDEAVLQISRKARLHSEQTGKETKVDYSALSQAFKDALDKFRAKWANNEILANRPIPPVDTDDQTGMAEYKSDLGEYESALDDYDRELGELTSSQDWQTFSEAIKSAREWGEISADIVAVTYYSFPEGGEQTVENVFKGLPGMLRGFKTEITSVVSAYGDKVEQLSSDNKGKQVDIEKCNETLAREQEDFTKELNRLTQELAQCQAKVTALTDEKNQCENELQQAKDDYATAIRKVESQRNSYREGLANMKERRDHRIRRDVSKGQVAASSRTLGTGTINRGKADRVYIGQKFVVAGMDRGGNRINKGEILITAVDFKHAASFRIVSQSVPITGGDNIFNPLYNPTDPINVYIYGKLDKWPRTLVESRLKPLGVKVQDEINGKTDYIVIPNSMGVKPAAPSGDEEDEEEEDGGAAAGSSPLEQLEKRARRFGAVVITERLFDAFLDY